MTTTHSYDYDYFVIGGGSGGVRSARIAAGHGAKVGLAESARLGGTCVNVGCIPKKHMSYAAEYPSHAKDAQGYGWSEQAPQLNWQTMIANKDTEIARLNGIYGNMLNNAGVTVHNGYASLIDAHTVNIDGGQHITADKILIAVGGAPRKPNYPGAQYTIDSDEFFELPEHPKAAIIQGGGYIAVEFAQILNGLGSDVTLMYRGDLFLRGFDMDIRQALLAEMEKQGITVMFNDDITAIEKNDAGFTAQTKTGQTLQTDCVIAAIGRDANTAGLSLGNANVETEPNGKIPVGEDYATNIPHIFAVGDIANSHNLTPVATGEGHALADNLFGGHTGRKISYNFIPTAIFSKPQIATIGYSEGQALEKDYDIDVYTSGFKPLVHTLSGRDERTFMKMIVDRKTDQVIGCHMMGKDAAEIMQGFAVAMKAGATKADFDATIGIHPTSAEEFVTMRSPRE
jgi:glutathione reductase (NADPH)